MTWDTVWEKIFQSQEWGKYPAESLIQFVARNFYKRDRAQTRILEVGCGPGPNIWYLAREGFLAYGIDGSTTAIAQAEKRLSSEGLSARLDTGDISSLPYPDVHFDAVIDNECIYCNSRKDTEKILSEIKRVLKKQGLFYSRTVSSEMHIGKSHRKLGPFEYTDISDGIFKGKGFVRLIDKPGINDLYGKYFTIRSIDSLTYTQYNNEIMVKEWIIVAEK